jgi:hypothetical protein
MNDMNENEDHTSILIDSLRAEMLEAGRTDEVEVVLPPPVLKLFLEAPTDALVASAIDDLLVDEEVIDDDLYFRLTSRLRDHSERRWSMPKYLEQIVVASREERSSSIDDVASSVGANPVILEAIEEASARFDELTEDQVAAWIQFLELDLDTAAAALELSLSKPAVAYQGDGLKHRDHARQFASRVRDLVVEARRSE